MKIKHCVLAVSVVLASATASAADENKGGFFGRLFGGSSTEAKAEAKVEVDASGAAKHMDDANQHGKEMSAEMKAKADAHRDEMKDKKAEMEAKAEAKRQEREAARAEREAKEEADAKAREEARAEAKAKAKADVKATKDALKSLTDVNVKVEAGADVN